MDLESDASAKMVIVTGADENYTAGLLVTILSLLHHLPLHQSVKLYVLDGGIKGSTKEKLITAWTDERLKIEWILCDTQSLSKFVIAGHLNHSTYLRLLIPSILPDDCDKALYLDSDLLIRSDITNLWNIDVEEFAVLAGQETSSPYVDSAVKWAPTPQKFAALGTTTPIPNYRDLGMNPLAKVFNAGVLLINVRLWRERSIPDKLANCLEANRDHVLFCDQYALNVELAQSWKEIDTRWNVTTQFYEYYTNVDDSPFDEQTFKEVQQNSWIAHFTGPNKPWMPDFEHPHCDEFRNYLDRASWPKTWVKAPQVDEQPISNSWSKWFNSSKKKIKALMSKSLKTKDAA